MAGKERGLGLGLLRRALGDLGDGAGKHEGRARRVLWVAKQRANLASLQILMGTYFQHLISTPRRWSEQGLPGLFPGAFY